MNDWLRSSLGSFNPQIQKAGAAGSTPAGGAVPSHSLLQGNAGVDAFVPSSVIHSDAGHSDVRSLVNKVNNMPLHEAKGQLSPITFAGLKAAAESHNFEFPPIGN